eukprot:58026-Chlamydomonas_euryale.AAC.6
MAGTQKDGQFAAAMGYLDPASVLPIKMSNFLIPICFYVPCVHRRIAPWKPVSPYKQDAQLSSICAAAYLGAHGPLPCGRDSRTTSVGLGRQSNRSLSQAQAEFLCESIRCHIPTQSRGNGPGQHSSATLTARLLRRCLYVPEQSCHMNIFRALKGTHKGQFPGLGGLAPRPSDDTQLGALPLPLRATPAWSCGSGGNAAPAPSFPEPPTWAHR